MVLNFDAVNKIFKSFKFVLYLILLTLGGDYEPVGCFHDSGVIPRPLPELLANFRPEIDWHHVELTVDKCAQLAKKKG